MLHQKSILSTALTAIMTRAIVFSVWEKNEKKILFQFKQFPDKYMNKLRKSTSTFHADSTHYETTSKTDSYKYLMFPIRTHQLVLYALK
jgi:hypothetical protein